MPRVRKSKIEAMEANGHRPVGYVAEYRTAAAREDETYLYLSRKAQDTLLKQYDPKRLERKPALSPKPKKKEWPWYARMLAAIRTDEDRGLGDTVKRLLWMPGITFERVMKRLEINCGCGDRQEKLNRRYPY